MKRFFLIVCLIGCLFIVGCASGSSNFSVSDTESSGSNTVEDMNFTNDSGYSYEEIATDEENKDVLTASKKTNEMLVYRCDMSIDTLDFETSVSDFKKMVADGEGYIEEEMYSDGNGMYNEYYIEEGAKKKQYMATVRVPFSAYTQITDGAGNFGDVRSKESQVDNVTQEYVDAKTALEIYEAKEQRYIQLLSTITDDSYAIEVERELTDLEIEIAQLRSRMQTIETDVVYSYITITIREVTKYVEEELPTDTFGQRLSKALNGSWSGFLKVCECVLYLLIYLLPYLIIMGFAAGIIIWIVRKKLAYAKKQKEPPKD